MANFKKSDLKLIYSWTAAAENDNAKITGIPDSTLLDRHEGYEVLPFLNRYLTSKNSTSLSALHKLEDALRDKLPGTTRSHANIKKWLDDNITL
ncbi:hypothetical protein FLA105534_03775 [Flavobacterium bizetiae]|uniref:Uncharacterized protein n=1 Tax=Flavobacterium bizetiae TaxID=2704140 RepID=A0A6J4GW95_9FLAO|nr:hypothetical protein [Flavobacterium bizetiae]CAA9201793.1 hypothetical protein FLA105534_03775 [Flavobacterium bizetiae]CAD5341605.1 hypothetical protein FLA105535_01579 [Flavobacterium bizetiae]CAD5348191.1 hypothetical protein FLA105534_02151 [Flavobacterium bizetiae]